MNWIKHKKRKHDVNIGIMLRNVVFSKDLLEHFYTKTGIVIQRKKLIILQIK